MKKKRTVADVVKQLTKKKTVNAWTLEDAAHFIIYRELDKLRVPFPYEKATRICNELRAAVSYRTAPKTGAKPRK